MPPIDHLPGEAPLSAPERRRRQRQALLRGGVGHLLPVVAALPFVAAGRLRLGWSEWLVDLSVVVGAWSVLLLVHGLRAHERLGLDLHFLLLPALASAPLLWMHVWFAPDLRLLQWNGWCLVLLFGAGLWKFAQLLWLNAYMAVGYLGTTALLLGRGEELSLPAEVATVTMLFALFAFYASVLDRMRRRREETRGLRAELAHLALTDPLTGLPNRRAFEGALARESARSRRDGSIFSVALLDLDHFKEINDQLGHEAGDQLLAELATLLQTQLREADLAARIGGDELAVLLPGTVAGPALGKLERLRAAIAAHPFGSPGLADRRVTVSIGVVASAGGESAVRIVRRADAGLYAAKHAGRDRVAPGPPPDSALAAGSGPRLDPDDERLTPRFGIPTSWIHPDAERPRA